MKQLVYFKGLSKPFLDKVIAVLFISGDTSGIFSLITREDKRNLGYGAEMVIYLMNTAKELGMKYAVLSASNDSGLRLYKRLGFNILGKFKCFEWKVKK